MESIESIFPITTGRDPAGQMTVAGHSLRDLADQYGTPLYVYDAETIRVQVITLRDLLSQLYPGQVEVAYAAKAYFSSGMARRLKALNLGLDVVSLGELILAEKAGFLPERVHLHGNNKSYNELKFAMTWGVQAVVVDSLDELEYLNHLAVEVDKKIRIWLRITPGIDVDTHPYRQTANLNSKFGLQIHGGDAARGIRRALALPHLHLSGLHAHLGSQIFEIEPYRRSVKMLVNLADDAGYIPEEFSPGGGWGVPYTSDDKDGDPQPWLTAVCQEVQDQFIKKGWKLPKLVIEPGRWLVARAGVAIYTVGTEKIASENVHILAVDGGIADNPRPALYHANYSARVVERPDGLPTQTARIVGKFCESGDELIPRVDLPEVRRGDHLVLPVAGAYQLSMASNYNLAARPAVLWLERNRVDILQPRIEAFEDPWWSGEPYTL
jgi:diaminopimelate decarboxylase